MQEQFDVPLASLTTLHLGGPARRLVTATGPDEIVEMVTDADRRGEPLLVLGGGSNLVIGDHGFDGTVLRIATTGIRASVPSDAPGSFDVAVQAGENWDDVVSWSVSRGAAGIECLSGIPGSAGATPIQNVGAYGQEVSETVTGVTVLDRRDGTVAELDNAACGFTYRHSIFKGDPRYVVLSVSFRLIVAPDRASAPIRYAELARALGVAPGERAGLAEAREAVLGLRRGKGMVLDAGDHDTWSAGSFFTNPLLSADAFARLERLVTDRWGPEARLPRFPGGDGRIKTSAAWLIEKAGFVKGYGDGPARISTKHTLALTNRGTAKTEDLLALAREVRDGVREAFGVELVNEPVMVGATL